VKLGDFPIVEALVATRNHLIELRDHGGIDITISGQLQLPDFVEVVAPAIRLELGRRIADIEVQLGCYGVDIDSAHSATTLQLR
jgi:hypothetical protein